MPISMQPLLPRASVNPDQPVEQARLENPGQKRDDPEQKGPAVLRFGHQEIPGNQGKTDDDAKDAVNAADVLGHEKLLYATSSIY